MISYTQTLSGNAINGVCQILNRERPAMIWPGNCLYILGGLNLSLDKLLVFIH